MAGFLTTIGTSNRIERIIMEADEELVLISPYLKLTRIFLERLSDAVNRGVKIKIVYGKEDLNYRERKSLTQLDNLELYFSKNLHAKCYYNEFDMVITSMNMYEFSEKNNREMGIVIESRGKDRSVFSEALSESESIINSACLEFKSDNLVELEKRKIEKQEEEKRRQLEKEQRHKKIEETKKGFCIRCNTSINLNPHSPLCDSCFSRWAYYGNVDFAENYCHSCGKSDFLSYARPLCYTCYKSLPDDIKKTMGRDRFELEM